MAPSSPSAALPPPPRPWLDRLLVFLLLVVVIYTFPNKPVMDLDASWRMALGKFFLDGLQFGRDVVFTYGPLGFLMGKTYAGSTVLFRGMLVWQLFAAIIFAGLIMLWGERQAGPARFFFYAFFVLFGVSYEDALHMLMIALVGFELFRRLGPPRSWGSVFLVLLLALLGNMKFTDLMLGLVIVLVGAAHELWLRRFREAASLLAWYAGGFLAVWLLCRQNPLNLPAYFINSWHVSQGYQEVMGITTPPDPLWKAVVALAVLALYAGYNLWSHPDRPRTLARSALLGAFIYLNWKHGFVRADGHMIGFFYCALLPIVAFPFLLEDGAIRPRLKRWVLVPAGVLCLLGVRDAIPPVIDSGLAMLQGKVWTNVYNAAHLAGLQNTYNDRLAEQRIAAEMLRTQAVVGRHTLDVIGFEQAAALFNRFNYTPRPVLQSYSAYTPELARLNTDFYKSDRAPDFILLQVNSIDERLPAMDDSEVLYIISHRYTYVLSEKGFQLWRRTPGAFDYAPLAPRPLQTRVLPVGESWVFDEYADQHLWVSVDLTPSLLGRLRNFAYKPPQVFLEVQDTAGAISTYRMATPIGRSGFILSPLVVDLMAFIHFSGGTPERRVHRLTVQVAPEDRKYFTATARVELSALVPSLNGREFFAQVNRERFHMFSAVPVAYDAQAAPSEEKIDGQTVMVMHAPSEMTFDVPRGATEVNGQHGFLAGAYTNGGNTNGAEFLILWSDGKSTVQLYRRYLDPVAIPEDRGLKAFHVPLKNISSGRLYFKVLPGPNNNLAWDWTGWTGIEFK